MTIKDSSGKTYRLTAYIPGPGNKFADTYLIKHLLIYPELNLREDSGVWETDAHIYEITEKLDYLRLFNGAGYDIKEV